MSTARERWSASALAELAGQAGAAGCRVAVDEVLSRYTSMGVGGAAPLIVWPRRADDVRELAAWMGQRGLPWRVLGGGTNLLVDDRGIDDVVIHTGSLQQGAVIAAGSATLPAGMPMAQALKRTADAGRDGLVWASGLPGTIGGAAAGNAGCWGGDMASVVASIDLVDGEGRARDIQCEQLGWDYRTLRLPDELPAPLTIVAVTVRTTEGRVEELRDRYAHLQSLKRSRQPVGARNSGCVFRNPGGQSAGQLLDESGCKQLRVNDAEVSSTHANFIINRGTARCADVDALISQMQARVRERRGIDLEPEIRRW